MFHSLKTQPSTQQTNKITHSKSFRESVHNKSSSQSDKNSSINSSIRKASAHEFARQIECFQQGTLQKKKKMATLQSMTLEDSKNILSINNDDVFMISRIHDTLETHYQNLEKENSPMRDQESEDLDYVTFRMVKQKQKQHIQELRTKFMPNHHTKKNS